MSTEIPGTLAEIRAQRNALNMEEDAISYVRRLAQGRLDLVQDEERRRASGADAPVGSLADRLADVFGQQHRATAKFEGFTRAALITRCKERMLDSRCNNFYFSRRVPVQRQELTLFFCATDADCIRTTNDFCF